MKKFSIRYIHRIHTVVAFAVVGVLLGVAYFTNSAAFKTLEVRADASSNVSGWAWSENIGWISFNSTDESSGQSYGVNVNSTTGAFSGKAWSENIGWISFDPTDLANCPSGACNAQVDLTTGKVTGWARALAGCQATAGVPATSCSSGAAGAAAGGWDGWIKLSGIATDTDSSSYSVDMALSGGKFSGYAWGSEVVGWIDFAPSIGGVPIPNNAKVSGLPCTQSNPTFFFSSTCVASAQCYGEPSPRDVDGTNLGACSDGSITAVPITKPCMVSQACVRDVGTGKYIYGDTHCDPGETLSNSASDCKPKAKFWQF